MRKLAFGLVIACLGAVSGIAQADIIVSDNGLLGAANRRIALGVDTLGQLNVLAEAGDPITGTRNGFDVPSDPHPATGHTGIAFEMLSGLPAGRDPGFYDATSPGCLCEGWGILATNADGTYRGFANNSAGIGGLTAVSQVTDVPHTTTTVTTDVDGSIGPGALAAGALRVEQAYSTAIAGALFQDVVTITNNTGSTITDLKYVRVMDWDVPFTEFSDEVSILGVGPAIASGVLELSHDDGFESADPAVATSEIVLGTTNISFTDSGPVDHGAYFKFDFANPGNPLLDGQSHTFTVLYGAAASQVEMVAALTAAGVELYSLGQSDVNPVAGTPITYAFGFKGLGLPIIPEPSSMVLVACGLALLGYVRRRAVG
jgi:type IV pilus assembly protein PilY1